MLLQQIKLTQTAVSFAPNQVPKIRPFVRKFLASLPKNFCVAHGIAIRRGGNGIGHLKPILAFFNDRHGVFGA
jgi:hypothetical protein